MQLFHNFNSDFIARHNSPTSAEIDEMLSTIGVDSLETLISQTIPANIRRTVAMDLPEPISEHGLLAALQVIASKNKLFKNYIGLGYYNTLTPTVILRNILENPGWYTQYTPYQAEIAQGRLEALLNYQTLVTDLTGMELANASLLDEATAAAEAMSMFWANKPKTNGNKLLVSDTVYPQTLDVIVTRAQPLGIEVVVANPSETTLDNTFFGLVLQYPNKFGAITNLQNLIAMAKEQGVQVAVGSDLLALTLLKAPGEMGADVVYGSSQRLGVPMGYGGPHAAFFATHASYKRDLPGRLIGVSIDAHGNKALRMALQTREQHIKREKATSNICTAQVLLAIMASMYAVYHGPKGLKRIASKIHGHAVTLADGLKEMGFDLVANHFFDTITVKIDPKHLLELKTNALDHSINLCYHSENVVGISFDESTNEADVQTLLAIFATLKNTKEPNLAALTMHAKAAIPEHLMRQTAYLEHPVFNSYHSEHEMLRYIKRLEAKDLSLCHSMIPLGSCTMKLNATTEMIPVTWKEFGALHPFAPQDQAEGYKQIFDELSKYLTEVTGFPGISLQPNAGAQGEYAGLMVIRAYFNHIKQAHRNIALIPSSAHGTNPASAVMAGMQVVVVKCDENGNIDLIDLQEKATKHQDNLAVLMVTYPSTHGVFETAIQEICATIHQFGGQVYMDGANMNAQVGLTSPALIGADVCHLNLHKTFCIPHGGGGPGMGPIGVAAHLKPFLPGHALVDMAGELAMSAVSAAPWGSASILLISYAYIRLMGAEGLTNATRLAILNANYLKARLASAYNTLYEGENGRVAHEMILDTRVFKMSAGVEVEDIAKRLMDYGYHAPTVSFPVAGTLMIEPTESESKAELDRFADAMLQIRDEIKHIELGLAPREQNLLKNAPHTAKVVLADEWDKPYTRAQAAFPNAWVAANKFWPSISRINNTYGDRNLVCTCPPIENYELA